MTIDHFQAGLVTALSFISGVASYLQGRRDGRLRGGALDMASELLTALVAGWSILFLGLWKAWPESLLCLCVIAAANNGSVVMSGLRGMLWKIIKLLRVT